MTKVSPATVAKTVVRRWRRNLLTVLAMAIGTTSVVAMLGISQATAQRITERISAYDATTISASLPSASWSKTEQELQEAGARIPGLMSLGTLVLPDSGTSNVELEALNTHITARAGTVIATREGLDTRGATYLSGGLPSAEVSLRDPYAVVLGTALAKELGVTAEPGANRFKLNGQYATAVGLLRDGPSGSALTTSLIMTPQTAEHLNVSAPTRGIIVQASTGAGATTGLQLPLALHPEEPAAVTVSVPPSPQQLRDQLLTDTRSLVLIVTVVMVGATSFGIITTMQISVWERRREIGLSRAMGMTRGMVARTLMWESILLGAAGSVIGWAFGTIITAAVAYFNDWTHTLPFEVLVVPFIGIVVGAIGGVLPAASAARIDPAELLRS